MKEDGVDAFLEQHGGPVGEFIKFSKDAKYERISDGEEIKVGTRLICVFPETQHGWVKFNGAGSRQRATWAECSTATCHQHVAN